MRKYQAGDRVIPIAKTKGNAWATCAQWSRAKDEQGFLYVKSYNAEEGAYVCNRHATPQSGGSFYRESDLIPYTTTEAELFAQYLMREITSEEYERSRKWITPLSES